MIAALCASLFFLERFEGFISINTSLDTYLRPTNAPKRFPNVSLNLCESSLGKGLQVSLGRDRRTVFDAPCGPELLPGTHTHTHTNTYTHAQTRAHIHAREHTRRRMHNRTPARKHTHTHARPHTHPRFQSSGRGYGS